MDRSRVKYNIHHNQFSTSRIKANHLSKFIALIERTQNKSVESGRQYSPEISSPGRMIYKTQNPDKVNLRCNNPAEASIPQEINNPALLRRS